MVPWQEVDRYRDILHSLDGTRDSLSGNLVGLEDIPADHHELAILFFRNAPKLTDGIKSGLGESLLNPLHEKMAGHSNLPIAGMKKASQERVLFFRNKIQVADIKPRYAI